MADIRPKDLLPTAALPADDDYLLLDGETQGTRKILASATLPAISVKSFGAKGDGAADDRAAIQAAEDHCAALGHPVTLLFEGVFNVSDRIDKKAKVHWRGSGTIRRPDPTLGSGYPIVLAFEVDDWSIEDLTIQNGNFEDLSGTTSNLRAYNTCIAVAGCNRWRVSKCTFNKYRIGLNVIKSFDFQIADNYFDAQRTTVDRSILWNEVAHTIFPELSVATGDIQSYPWFSLAGYDGTSNIGSGNFIVSGNRCMSVGLRRGIELHQLQWKVGQGIITKNVVYGKSYGIISYTNTSQTDPVTYRNQIISNNYVSYCYAAGIYVREVNGVLVTGNYLYRNSYSGPYTSGSGAGICLRIPTSATYPDERIPVMVTNNYLLDTGNPSTGCDAAIFCRIRNSVIENNVIMNSAEAFDKVGRGILSAGTSSGKSTGAARVANNVIENFGKGIEHIKSNWNEVNETVMIINNDIRKIASRGIDCHAYGRAHIMGNVIRDVNPAGTGDLREGLQLFSSPKSVVANNQFINCWFGIRLDRFSSENYWQQAQEGIPSPAGLSRGPTVELLNNQFWQMGATPTTAPTGDFGYSGRYGRVRNAVGNTWDGVNCDRELNGTTTGAPNATTGNGKTFANGELFWRSGTLAAGNYAASICVTAGTAGDVGTVMATTKGTTTISIIGTNKNDIYAGCWINIAGVSNGPFQVTARGYAADTATLSATPNATVTDAAVTYAQPVFKGWQQIEA